MTLLEKCKLALRISHTRLDDVINEDIETARIEMIRVGIPSTIAESNNKLVSMAISSYVQMKEGNIDKVDLYEKAWRSQLDEIRKSVDYIEV